jgi:hypothetical protein
LAIPLADIIKGKIPARILALVFIVVCVFDPANKILGAKVVVFVVLCALTFISVIVARDQAGFPVWLVIYVATFVAIPVLSLVRYDVIHGGLPSEGLNLLKGYLLISLAIVLVLNRFDLVPQLSAVLTAGACLTISAFLAIEWDYGPVYNALQPFGLNTGLFGLDERDFGRFRFLQVYFATSPMMVVAIAYYFDRAMSESGAAQKLRFAVAAAINVIAMFVAGTRNNMIASLLLPFLLWPLYSRRPGLHVFYCFGGVALLALLSAGHIKAFFDPSEFANNIRLATFWDYMRMFRDPATLMLGQGLGAEYEWTARGQFYISELTYLEVIRNFGLIGGAVILMLISVPVGSAVFQPTSRRDKALAVAYFLYLVTCATSPSFFSSMGILILAILLANIAQAHYCVVPALARRSS